MGKKRKTKPKDVKIDGLSPKDKKRLRSAIRQVWSWSYPRKLCIQRATDKEGFGHCENKDCRKKVPKVYADHITPCGRVDAGFIERMWTPSKNLQALCQRCHNRKTAQERKENAKLDALEEANFDDVEDFY